MPIDRFTLEQRLFMYDNFVRTKDAKKVRKQFKKQYPTVDPPHKATIHKIVKRFRKTGSLTSKVENQISKKSYAPRKMTGAKKKIAKSTNLSRETKILNTSGRSVTRSLQRRNKNISEVQEMLPDDQEPNFETVRIDSSEAASMYIPEDCMETVKSEPLQEFTGDEVCNESKCSKMIKIEPDSEDTKSDVCATVLNGNSIKPEPHFDEKSPVNKLKSETVSSENFKLLEDQIKQEVVEDDDTVNHI